MFQEGKKYRAQINLETQEVTINEDPSIWHWRWYNWLGIGLEKIKRQTLKEVIGSPLSIKKEE